MPLLLLASWLGTSCGELHFVPSPYSPQQVQLIYSKQEKVTLIRWRVGANPVDSTRFELLDTDGTYKPIRWEDSVFPGGVHPCADERGGSCAQFVKRGQYRVAADAHPVRSIHDTYGLVPGSVAVATEAATTLAIKAYFGPQNKFVYMTRTDQVADDGAYKFPRDYQRGIWPSSGLCLTDVVPSGVTLTDLSDPTGFDAPSPLSDLGSYCVGARPIPGDRGDATVAQTRALTVPVFVNGETVYQPPSEKTPIIYRIVLDLLLPINLPDYHPCPLAMERIETLVDSYMNQIDAPHIKEPTIDLAGGDCQQKGDRQLDVPAIGTLLQNDILNRTEREQRPMLFYFNNIDLPLPDNLVLSFNALQSSVDATAGHNVWLLAWFFGPPMAQTGQPGMEVQWGFSVPWLSWEDPSLGDRLTQAVRDELPYVTELHDPLKPVALLSDADVAKYDGSRIKICSSAPTVEPATMSGVPLPGYASWPVQATDPPGYTVVLDPEIAIPAKNFITHKVKVQYQICTRYCSDHPYVDESQTGQTSWAVDPTCAAEGS